MSYYLDLVKRARRKEWDGYDQDMAMELADAVEALWLGPLEPAAQDVPSSDATDSTSSVA